MHNGHSPILLTGQRRTGSGRHLPDSGRAILSDRAFPPYEIYLSLICADDTENQGYIMRSKEPEDVFFPAYLAEAQAAEIYILKAADLSVCNHLRKFDNPPVVRKDMTDKNCLS